MTEPAAFRLGWLVNPYAGVGGPAAHKGSDAEAIRLRAQRGELALTAPARAAAFWRALVPALPADRPVHIVTLAGPMGADCLPDTGAPVRLVHHQPAMPSTAEDTVRAAALLVEAGVDLLVFVGGDGTARDVCRAVGATQAVLGVPAGVKMHSGVYAISPELAAQLVAQMASGRMVGAALQEVRDIDEHAFQKGVVRAQYFGEMLVPEEEWAIQGVKQGGLDVDELILLAMADYLQQALPAEALIVLGPGSTTFHIAGNWGIQATLLGVDLVQDGTLLAADVNADDLLRRVLEHPGPVHLVVTAIGGQGHVIGRGNQQISSPVLRHIGRSNVHIVATRQKLATLSGRPLQMDSGDADLDQEWQGLMPVLTGFDQRVLYPLGGRPTAV